MLSRVQGFSCPICGGDIGAAQPIERVLEGDFTVQQRIVLEAMKPLVGSWITAEQIEKVLWGETKRWNSGGHPSSNPSRRLISVQITHLRDKLAAYGWTIKGDRRGRYKLIPAEGGA